MRIGRWCASCKPNKSSREALRGAEWFSAESALLQQRNSCKCHWLNDLSALTKDGVIETYARWAPSYDATFGRVVGHYHWHIANFVKDAGARRVIEVGVGTGLSLRHYPAGTFVVGVDICPRMLDKARTRQQSGSTNAEIELQLVDGEQLPYKEETFDAVVLPFVISVTPDPKRLLAEAFRILIPGGHVLIVNHFAGVRGLRWLEKLFSPFARLIGFESNLALSALLADSSFKIVSIKPLRPMGFFTLVHLQKP